MTNKAMHKVMAEPYLKGRIRAIRRGGDVSTHIKAMELEPKIAKTKKSVRRKALQFDPEFSRMIANKEQTERTLMRWESDRQYEILRRRMAQGLHITSRPRQEAKRSEFGGKSLNKKDPSWKRL